MSLQDKLRELVAKWQNFHSHGSSFEYAECADELEAILKSGDSGEWVLVPSKPTEEMIEAAIDFEDALPLSDWGKMRHITHEETYAAMISAAPTLPADGIAK